MFLDLPAELRIQIYQIIVDQTTVTTKNSVSSLVNDSAKDDERLYGGLLFSCKRVLEEYKSEAAKLIMPIDSTIHELWRFKYPLLIAQPSMLSLPTHIHIALPINSFGRA